MTPPLTDKGTLPVDVHDVELQEVEALFGSFQKSDRRMKLFAKLADYIQALKRAEFHGELIIDGSFVMACIDEPEDIDVVLVLPHDWDLTADLSLYQYNLVSKRSVKRTYPIEVFPVVEGSEAAAYWRDYFHQVNVKWYEPHGFAAGDRKGLLRVRL